MAELGGSAGIDRLPATDPGIEHQKGRGAGMNKVEQDPVIRALNAEIQKIERKINRLHQIINTPNPIEKWGKVYNKMIQAVKNDDHRLIGEMAAEYNSLYSEIDRYWKRDERKLLAWMCKLENEHQTLVLAKHKRYIEDI